MERVSIVIPVRDEESAIGLVLEHVQKATAEIEGYEFEVIVVDDGSSDDTPALLAHYRERDARFIGVRNTTSQGACAARNQALRLARGRFATGLDDDDEFLPRHLEGLVRHWQFLTELDQQPSALYVQYRYRDGEKAWTSSKIGHADAASLLQMNHVGNQLFAPLERFIGAGLFDERMPAWQDLEFFYRLLLMYGPARLLDVPSYVFDVTPRPDRISSKQKDKILAACQLMHEKHGRGDRRMLQALLLNQVYSEYYGFPVQWADVVQFMRQGFWPHGCMAMLKKFTQQAIGARG